MNENEIFKTKDFYLTAFLKANGLNIARVMEGNKENELYFCFTGDKDLPTIIEDFYSGNSHVKTTKFVNSIRDLKSLIYNLNGVEISNRISG